MGKIHGVHEVLLQLKKISLCFVQCHGRVHELFSFEKSGKIFLQFDLQKKKKLRQTH